ncbi:MAG: T9SS type A sorting domain-containing protein [Cytophagales bacterium]|nr:T9SS type A sorting domain-containing protein [Cytophagales bacterium]
MHKKSLLFALVALLVCQMASAQVALTVDMGSVVNPARAEYYCLNFQNALNPAVASNTAYKARVDELKPKIVRYHAGEQIQNGHSYNWVDYTNKVWNKTKIGDVLRHKPASATDVLITITGWPTWMDVNADKKLDEDKKAAYAAFCADLVDIVNNQLGLGYKVKYWEPFNEKDGGDYKGSSDMWHLADIFKRCHDAMKLKDPNIKVVGGAWRQPWDADIDHFLYNLGGRYLDVWSHHNYASGGETNIPAVYRKANLNGGIDNVRNKLNAKGFSAVPIWLDEWNIFYSWEATGYAYMTNYVSAVFDALVLKNLLNNGKAAAVFVWNAADGRYGKIRSDFTGLNPGGHVFKLFGQYGVGNVMRTTSSRDTLVDGLTIKNSGGGKVMFMLINRSQTSQNVTLGTGTWGPSADGVLKRVISPAGYAESSVSWAGSIAGKVISTPANSVTVFIATIPVGSRVATLEENASISRLAVHPNPSSGVLHLRRKDAAGDVRVAVYDVAGRKIAEVAVNGDAPATLDLSGQRPGVYLLKTFSRQGKPEVLKVVLQ